MATAPLAVMSACVVRFVVSIVMLFASTVSDRVVSPWTVATKSPKPVLIVKRSALCSTV